MEITKIGAPSVYHMFSLYLVYLLFWFVKLRPHFGVVYMILVLIPPVPGHCLLYFGFMVYFIPEIVHSEIGTIGHEHFYKILFSFGYDFILIRARPRFFKIRQQLNSKQL